MGWSGTIAPSKAPFAFIPAAREVSRLAGDLPDQDFVGSLPRLFVNQQAGGSGDGSSWADACNNLQTALSLAQPGMEVWVVGAIYVPGGRRTNSFRCSPGVNVYGGFTGVESSLAERDWQAHLTVLDGQGAYHVVRGANGGRLDGFVITGGNANGVAPDDSGGGVWADVGVTNFLLANCRVTTNAAASQGGGCFQVTLVGSEVSSNQAAWGGGVAACTLTDCQLQGNWAPVRPGVGSASGGGAWGSTLTRCLLAGNDTEGGGGGAGQCGLTKCVLTGNCAFGGGGAADSSLTGCLVAGNGAPNASACAGCSILNCTLADNPGGIGLMGTSAINSIIYGSTSLPTPAGPFWIHNFGNTFAYCDVYPDPELGGDHNLTNNPAFVNAAQGDYRLALGRRAWTEAPTSRGWRARWTWAAIRAS